VGEGFAHAKLAAMLAEDIQGGFFHDKTKCSQKKTSGNILSYTASGCKDKRFGKRLKNFSGSFWRDANRG
jgi:hypothetical protein